MNAFQIPKRVNLHIMMLHQFLMHSTPASPNVHIPTSFRLLDSEHGKLSLCSTPFKGGN
jgi:hypothetical protein